MNEQSTEKTYWELYKELSTQKKSAIKQAFKKYGKKSTFYRKLKEQVRLNQIEKEFFSKKLKSVP